MQTETVGDRIRILRRHYGLNQTDFGSRIGLSQSTIGGYEQNTHSVAEYILIHICKEYRASDLWLRTGEGEMLESGGDDFVAELASKYQLSDFQQTLVRAVYEMPPELQDMVMEVARKLVSEAAAPPEPVETDYERTTRIVNDRLDALEDEQAAAATDKRA